MTSVPPTQPPAAKCDYCDRRATTLAGDTNGVLVCEDHVRLFAEREIAAAIDATQPPAAPETDVSALREAIENLHCLARGHDYADARELAAGEDAIDEVFDLLSAARERVRVVEGERDALMRASWLAYERSGADTDGDKQWHCAPEVAGGALVHAVETLRKDYDDSLDESESAEAAHAALRAGVEALADEWEGWAKARSTTRIDAFRDAAESLRALLAGDAR